MSCTAVYYKKKFACCDCLRMWASPCAKLNKRRILKIPVTLGRISWFDFHSIFNKARLSSIFQSILKIVHSLRLLHSCRGELVSVLRAAPRMAQRVARPRMEHSLPWPIGELAGWQQVASIFRESEFGFELFLLRYAARRSSSNRIRLFGCKFDSSTLYGCSARPSSSSFFLFSIRFSIFFPGPPPQLSVIV